MGLAPRGERTVTLGSLLGVFFTACRAATKGEGQRENEATLFFFYIKSEMTRYSGIRRCVVS